MITFKERLAAGVATPGDGKVTVFVESSTGAPHYKDDTGTVHPLKGADGSSMANPMTAAGDMIVGGAAGVPMRVAAGTAAFVWTSNGAGAAPSWQQAAAGGGGTYSGTEGSIQLTGSAFSIDPGYVGQASIATLGTVTTGTWDAAAISATKGGTGQTVYAVGDILYASSTTGLSKLAAGTNGHVITLAGGVPVWAAPTGGGGGLTQFAESLATESPNSVSAPVHALTPMSAETNASVALRVKGAGFLAAQVPDGNTIGGVARGVNAVDFQMSRNNAQYVASGANSAILGGVSNKANGVRAGVVAGQMNIAGATESFVGGGNSNYASGQAGAIAGGTDNTAGNYGFVGAGQYNTANFHAAVPAGKSNAADGASSFVMGELGSARGIACARVWGSPRLGSVQGQGQWMGLILCNATTNATPATLLSYSGGVSYDNQLWLPDSSVYYVKGMIVARQNASGDCKTWEFSAAIKRGTGAASTVLVGTPTVTAMFADAGAAAWTVAISANTAAGTLSIDVTGEASKAIKWVADVQSVQVAG